MTDNQNPISPHLQIYRWHISSLLSITHRIAGVINLLTLILMFFWILIFSFSELGNFLPEVNYDLLVPVIFIGVSILLISTMPTYSFKKIVIQRSLTKFLLFGIVLFFGALLVYTFKVLAISSAIYLCLIPISYFHYKKIKKEKNITSDKDEGLEDIL